MRERLALISLLIILSPAMGSLFKAEETIAISSPLSSNSYIVGNLVTINSIVNGDLFVAGNTININNEVNGDVMAGANVIVINGVINGDVRGLANSISINKDIKGELLTGCASIVINEGVTVEELNIGAASVIIAGTINGNATIRANNITITETGIIRGMLNYTSSNNAVIKEGGIVNAAQRNEPVEKELMQTKSYPVSDFFKQFWLTALILSLVTNLMTGFIMIKISEHKVEEFLKEAGKDWLSQSVSGFAFIVLVPIAAVIGLVTIIAAPISGVALAVYGIIIYLSSVLAAFYLGRKTICALRMKKQSLMIELLTGSIVIQIIGWVPVIGWLFKLIILLMSLGVATKMIKDSYHYCKKKRLC